VVTPFLKKSGKGRKVRTPKGRVPLIKRGSPHLEEKIRAPETRPPR